MKKINYHYIYISVIIFLMVVTFVGLVDWEKEPKEIKLRNETKLGNCEIWEICDYRQTICAGTDCPSAYGCWIERQNCDFKERSFWEYWIPKK